MKNTIKFVSWLSKWNSLSDILTIILVIISFVIIFVWLLRWKRRSFFNTSLSQHDQHNWQLHDLFPKPTYCNVCESGMVSGVTCTYCSLYCDIKCMKKAEKLFKCKQLSSNGKGSKQQEFWPHHWIKGNLKLDSICYLCNESTGGVPSLSDYRCCWCLRNVHDKCLYGTNRNESTVVNKSLIVSECDFGDHSKIILKPYLLIKNSNYFIQNQTLKDFKLDFSNLNENWTPLIVFANKNSGNRDADAIVTVLTSILNPLQIIEMNKTKPEVILNWLANYSDLVKSKILVCGGDGSVGWILEIISKIKFKKYEPSVAILPLGTGNDLSRVLRWGDGYVGDYDLEEILNDITNANLTRLDRWQIKIQKPNNKLSKVTYLNNYFSVGCDALVTLNFHRQRTNSYFANRIFNKLLKIEQKLIYFKYGTIDTFLKECRHLTDNVRLELDGKLMELPHLESIVVLNIPYWGGGVSAWNIGKSDNRTDISNQSINDGYLEVFGCYSSFHIAQLQVNLAEPYRIGQAKRVRIQLLKRFPVQIDGEPWEQNPCVIDISFFNQAIMLEKKLQ